MPQASAVGQVEPDADVKSFSCLTCRQRKVRCDRRDPCSNCIRAAKQCSFIPPLRGKRRKRTAPKEGLHAKLRRYEELLKSYGAKIEPRDNTDSSDVDTETEPDVEMAEDATSPNKNTTDPFGFSESRPKLVTENGSSRYFDNSVWSNLGDEFRHPTEEGFAESTTKSNIQASDLFVDAYEESGLLLGASSEMEHLSNLHFPFHILQQMWEVYTERVDPVMKILHLPTFWSTLSTAIQNPHNISPSLEALIFAFYFVTITSLQDSELQSIHRERKSVVSSRYRIAARQALINAEFLKSTNLMTLQAYVIFLTGMRNYWRSDSLFILSGVAVRLARRMGLHRDGTSLSLSPFETEMRRRLWWLIVQVDCRISEFSGTKPSRDLFLSDTKHPLNIEDEDLTPQMVKPPIERIGITSMVLVLISCDIIEFVRKISSQSSYDARWDRLNSSSLTLAEKDNMISQIEDSFERKYIRYLDPSNPLHYFTSVAARASICKMNLFVHNPRQYADSGVRFPQKERDIIFTNGLKLLEYSNLIHSNESMRKITWQVSTSYLWDTLLYVLIEARHRKTGPEVDRTWQLIGGVFSSYPQIFAEEPEPLYAALASWTLQVWDDCLAARKLEGLAEIPAPEYITALQRYQKPLEKFYSQSNGSINPEGARRNSAGYNEVQSSRYDENLGNELEFIESYDFSNLLSFDLEASEWVQWERLCAGQGV